MLQGKRDVDTVLTMGIMEDVSIIPQPAGGESGSHILICFMNHDRYFMHLSNTIGIKYPVN